MQSFIKNRISTDHYHFTVRCSTPCTNTSVHGQHNEISYLYLPPKTNDFLVNNIGLSLQLNLHPTLRKHCWSDRKIAMATKGQIFAIIQQQSCLCGLPEEDARGYTCFPMPNSVLTRGWKTTPKAEADLEMMIEKEQAGRLPTVSAGGGKESSSAEWWPSSDR